MRVSRVAAGLTAIFIAVVGLSVATTGPAAAAGAWHAYGNTNPITSTSSTYYWSCGPSKTIESNVLAQLCATRTLGFTAYRSAVIVRNNRSSLYGVETAAVLSESIGTTMDRSTCASSGVAPNSWSVCWGTSVTPSSSVSVYASTGGANGVVLDQSELI